jgi:hypothetical protein
MGQRLAARSGWVAAALVAVIAVPSTATAVTWIDGKSIKPETVKAKQLDPVQRSESWSFHAADALPVSGSVTAASRSVPAGQYLVQATTSWSNGNAFAVFGGCSLQGQLGTTLVTGDGTASIIEANGAVTIPLIQTVKMTEPDVLRLVCATFGNPPDVEVEDAFLLVQRVGINRHYED